MASFVNKITKSAKNPLVYFCLIAIILSFWQKTSDGGIKNDITSDSRGYYAYLPACFIYNDPTFSKAHKAEYEYDHNLKQQIHFYISKEGKTYNKYFPGVAIMQLAFFGLGTFATWLVGEPITGYSDIFTLFYLIGSYFYFVVGVVFFTRVVKWKYPEIVKVEWLIPLIYLSSPLIYYSLFSLLSHQYSFALFGLFFWYFIKLQASNKIKYIFILGLILGLIFLIRPTNVTILLAVPFFIKEKQQAIGVLKWISLNKLKTIFYFMLGSSLGVFLLLLTWKWETGKWFFWAYSGEGFNWTDPKIWQVLFSFRVGLFVHTPLLLFAVISTFLIVRKKTMQLGFWWIYFIVNLYIIAAWWCWDYESPLGMRPFTEHWFVLALPLFELYKKQRFLTSLILICTACLGILRTTQRVTQQYADQRFTAASYFKSLAFWDESNFGRWAFTESCLPFGSKIKSEVLLIENKEVSIGAKDEFALTSEKIIGLNHLDSRLFVTVTLEKKMEFVPMKDVLIVIDAYNSKTNARCYLTQPLFNDRFEADQNWKELIFSDLVYDNLSQCDRIKVYIWNKGQNTFKIRNFKAVLDEYKVL